MKNQQQGDWSIVEFRDRSEVFTSRERLLERSARLATALSRRGLGAGDSLCYLLANSIAVFEIIKAAKILGAYPVPINYHFKSDESRYILCDSHARAFVTSAEFVQSGREAGRGLEALDGRRLCIGDGRSDDGREGFDDYETAVADSPPWQGDPRPAPAVVIYTSGTTGNPKGVVREAASPEAAADMLTIFRDTCKMGDRPVHLVTGPLYHSAPGTFAAGVLALGGKLILLPKYDSERTLQAIQKYRVTNLHLVPTMMHRMLALPEQVRSRYDLSSVAAVQHAAAPCPRETKEAMIEWWGPVIDEYYGSTECGMATYITSAEALAHPGSVGRAIEDVTVAILKTDGDPCPAGEVGDVYVGNLASEGFQYYGDPDKRERSMKEGLFTNGDMGYLDEDGYLFLVDRRADMIISGGVNIYPAEIEAVLHGHKEVADCAVFGIPDKEWGEAVHAVIESAAEARLDAGQIQSYCAKHLSGYKVPRSVEFADQLPRQPSGKIYKRKLREKYWQGRNSSIV
ncbi:MAG: AMP-binding protein [Deltaproteobacteria bacterium]